VIDQSQCLSVVVDIGLAPVYALRGAWDCNAKRGWSEWLSGEDYLMPTTIDSGPTRCSTRVLVKPASFIQPMHSAPV